MRIRRSNGKGLGVAIKQHILLPGRESLLGDAPILSFLEAVKAIHAGNDQKADRQ